MILDLAYTNKDLYASNPVRYKPICFLLSVDITGLYIKNVYHPVKILTFTKFVIKIVILTKLTSA